MLRRDHRLPGAAPTGMRPGGGLGIYGFGASAHLAAQVAMVEGVEVSVMTRSASARCLAADLGAVFVGDAAADRALEDLAADCVDCAADPHLAGGAGGACGRRDQGGIRGRARRPRR